MHNYVLAKIKDQDLFELVFPLPFDGNNSLAIFIRSILGQTISVRKLKGHRESSFYFISDIDPRWVIMPSWIDYFDTDELVPACSTDEESIGLVVYWDGSVIVLGS